jgi:hypothetical protein
MHTVMLFLLFVRLGFNPIRAIRFARDLARRPGKLHYGPDGRYYKITTIRPRPNV